MFLGSVPPHMRAIVHETVTSWGVSELWHACAGNYTLPRCLPDLKHHGDDVTVYSSVLGWWATGGEIPVRLAEAAKQELGWLEPYMEDRDDLLATVMLMTRFLTSVGQDNDYHRRQVKAFKDQWETVHAKTVNNVKASGFRLESYAAKDASQWLAEDVPDWAPVLSFPPFLTAGGYEKMFEALDKNLEWPAPKYAIMDDAGLEHLMGRIMDRRHWLLGIPWKHDGFGKYLRGKALTTNRGVPIYVYASSGPTRVVSPNQKMKPVGYRRLGPGDVLLGNERISLAPLTGEEFAALRSLYLDPTIPPAAPMVAYAVKADEKILGCLAFNPPDGRFDSHTVYMLSDFPVAPVRYRRLAALMVKCAQSTEVQHVLTRALSRRVAHLATTAFTNNQVSMKYRTGGLTLVGRKPCEDGFHENQLQYHGDVGKWTLQEAYTDWHKKHAKHVGEADQ